jgi:uncharacterized protein YecE (DUF72 family)
MIRFIMARLYIGCSGFSYDHWRGRFYPEDIPKTKWLQQYSNAFSTVELNVTFYGLPTEKTFLMWHEKSPDNFIFSLKGSRFITHVKRLKDADAPIQSFFEKALLLREKLGAVLWQLPPGMKADTGRLGEFSGALKKYGARNAFEFRDESWINDKVISLFKNENLSLCMADWPPFLDDLPVTADFVYIRRHGAEGGYATSYSEAELKRDARRIEKYLGQGKDVYIYFNNDYMAYAPKNALRLREMLKTS